MAIKATPPTPISTGQGGTPGPGIQGVGGQTQTSGKPAIMWFIGGVLLVALAGPFPNVITLIVIILIVLVVLKNYQTYFAFFKA